MRLPLITRALAITVNQESLATSPHAHHPRIQLAITVNQESLATSGLADAANLMLAITVNQESLATNTIAEIQAVRLAITVNQESLATYFTAKACLLVHVSQNDYLDSLRNPRNCRPPRAFLSWRLALSSSFLYLSQHLCRDPLYSRIHCT